MLGSLIVRFEGGAVQTVVTDRAWSGMLTAQGEKLPAVELGGFDMAPWNVREPAPPLPELYPEYAATAQVLAGMGVPPDFESDGSVRYIHRTVDGAEIYFIANREAATRDLMFTFRVSGKRPEWWNPITGECRALPQFEERGGVTAVPLRLEALESGFVVFGKKGSGFGVQGSGENTVALAPVKTVEGPWEVAFDPKWGGPEKVTFSMLEDWSERQEAGIRHYSGTATYRKAFAFPELRTLSPDPSLFLDLGSVKNMASVTLNGKSLGTVWCAPWRVRIPAGVLRERGNVVEVTVANLWINRLIGDAGLPQEKRLTQTTRNPYKPDSPLQPSGLLGPVTLQAEAR
jgi:hypothetical protein